MRLLSILLLTTSSGFERYESPFSRTKDRKAISPVQATTAIVEKTVGAFYSTIVVVSTIAVVCCMERSIYQICKK